GPIVAAAFLVLTAEWLAGGANDQEIQVVSSQMVTTNAQRIDLADVALQHGNARVIEAVGRAGDRVVINRCHNLEVTAFQSCRHCPRTRKQVYCSEPAATSGAGGFPPHCRPVAIASK